MAHAIYQYSSEIATTTFAAAHVTGASRRDVVSSVLAVELDALLVLCRTIMRDIMNFIQHYSADSVLDAQNMSSIRSKMKQLVQHQGRVYTAACSGISSSDDTSRIHINALILFFGIFNIHSV
jgi:hypothetical protein